MADGGEDVDEDGDDQGVAGQDELLDVKRPEDGTQSLQRRETHHQVGRLPHRHAQVGCDVHAAHIRIVMRWAEEEEEERDR